MKKKILRRCLAGMPVGVMISVVITIIISLAIGDGKYYMVAPELVTDCGTEIAAELIDGGKKLPVTKMTAVHFLICSAATFPTAYLMRWMNHSVGGVLMYFVEFVAIYAVIWVVSYFATKKKIEAFNRKIGAKA